MGVFMFLVFAGVVIVLIVSGINAHSNAVDRIMKTPYDELSYSERFQKHEREKARENGTPEFDPAIVAISLICGIPALPYLLYLFV